MELAFDYTLGDSTGRSPADIELRRLEELVAAYQAFTGHELANQLVPLQGFARLLLLSAPASLDPESLDILARMATLTRQIEALARRMADLGRLLREPPFGPRLAISEVAREAVAEVCCRSAASALTATPDVDYHIQENLPHAG